MESCVICKKELGNENVIFLGYTFSKLDRYQHEDTLTMHADCCPSELVQRLELKLLFE
jgi:hypothetical protein